MTDYTPTIADVRDQWIASNERSDKEPGYAQDFAEQFDRALTEHDRQVAEKAFNRGALAGRLRSFGMPTNPYRKQEPIRIDTPKETS